MDTIIPQTLLFLKVRNVISDIISYIQKKLRRAPTEKQQGEDNSHRMGKRVGFFAVLVGQIIKLHSLPYLTVLNIIVSGIKNRTNSTDWMTHKNSEKH